jgi:hypothetical protein
VNRLVIAMANSGDPRQVKDADELGELARRLCRATARIATLKAGPAVQAVEGGVISQSFRPCEDALVQAYELGLQRGRAEKG